MPNTYRIFILAALLLSTSLFCQDEKNRLAMLFADTVLFQCQRIAINTSASDFGVINYKSGYVFCSSRNNHLGVQYVSEDSLSPLLDLYFFEKKDSAHFTKPKPFAKELNSKTNDGPAAFSRDGKKMICTKNIQEKKLNQNGAQLPLTLMSSNYEHGKWSKPEILSFCKPGFNYADPTFSVNDSILFFASDCSGGYGGMDIYYSKLTASGWEKPVNLGPKVNTSYNEVFPFCSASGNLYFSSNRPGGKGEMDIYAWTLSDSAFMIPQLLPDPVNSDADDFSFWCSENETEGFFSSNRNNKTTDDDIYYFHLDWPELTNYDTLMKPVLCYTFLEGTTTSNSDTAGVSYEWSFSDGTKAKGLKVQKCFDTTGTYAIHLDIRDSSTGEMILSNVDYDLEIKPSNAIWIFIPDTVAQNQLLTIDSQNAMLNGYTISSVYYDFGCGYKCEGTSASHIYHKQGIYYPKVFFKVKDQHTGAVEYRSVTEKIIVE